jgi:hypothetical protein
MKFREYLENEGLVESKDDDFDKKQINKNVPVKGLSHLWDLYQNIKDIKEFEKKHKKEIDDLFYWSKGLPNVVIGGLKSEKNFSDFLLHVTK